ncbi:MAG: hypothetical protein ACR2LC_09685 [Pyrinomonadaceae bacterium]
MSWEPAIVIQGGEKLVDNVITIIQAGIAAGALATHAPALTTLPNFKAFNTARQRVTDWPVLTVLIDTESSEIAQEQASVKPQARIIVETETVARDANNMARLTWRYISAVQEILLNAMIKTPGAFFVGFESGEASDMQIEMEKARYTQFRTESENMLAQTATMALNFT